MITKLYIENFRSIEKAEVDLGKITVLTGANNSGKSSVIYALLMLKNVVTNPNQSLENLLTLPFINLGGFENAVFQKDTFKNIKLGVETTGHKAQTEYSVRINPTQSQVKSKIKKPFTLEKTFEVSFPFRGYWASVNLPLNNTPVSWSGIYWYLEDGTDFKTVQDDKEYNFWHPIFEILNLSINDLSKMDFVPMRRGFSEPFFGTVPLSNGAYSEKEIATLLITDSTLTKKIAFYLEKIVERQLAVRQITGITSYRLLTKDSSNGFTADLVNEGLGTNQLVTILAKVLQKDNKFICIDEPEIHLHPSVISKLVGVLVEIAEKEGKQFLISTHSEHFITALLKHTHQKDIKPDDVKVYYLKKEGQKTVFEHQAINDKGQIEGGLVHFYETELEDLSSLFKLTN